MSHEPLLKVKDLSVEFSTERGQFIAADKVNFSLREGETLCLVGESGCGKSVTALALLRLLPPSAQITSGKVLFEDEDLLQIEHSALRKIRGKDISIIFQEPMTALNPVYSIGSQVMEVIRNHQGLSRNSARQKAIQVMEMVGMPATERFTSYPHELSGGMLQRVMIAMALSCRPTILIADEPTTALDVTIQAQILDLLVRLQRDLGMSVLLITHDLSIVAESADEVAVMYAGQVVERARTEELFTNPKHPYTEALLRSIPRPQRSPGKRLETIPGSVPELVDLPNECRFADRCQYVFEKCRTDVPKMTQISDTHHARCFRVES